jgi:hypothetical protein
MLVQSSRNCSFLQVCKAWRPLCPVAYFSIGTH